MAIREIEVNMPHQNINFRDHAYAHELLDGLQGIELGPSSHNSFHLPGSLACAPKDNFDFYKIQGQAQFNGKYCEIDIWGEASKINVPNSSQGYVISSHVVEHIPDLIRAFQEWNRILVEDGYVFMILPQRNALDADEGRDLSTLTDVLNAYEFEWTPDTVPDAVNHLAGGWRGHYWVFTMQSFLEIITGLNERNLIQWELIHTEDPDQKVGNGFCVVFKVHPLLKGYSNDVATKVPNETLPEPNVVEDIQPDATVPEKPLTAKKTRKKAVKVLE